MESFNEKSDSPSAGGTVDVAAGSSLEVDAAPVYSNWLERLKAALQVEQQPGTFAPGRWSNADLDPTPPEQQTWTTMNFIFYWLNDAIAPGNLRLGSSLYTVGLSWQLCLVIIALGHFLMAIGLTLNGAVGSRFHIPYTIQSRASFGIYFSFVVVVIRMVVAAFWYGINTYTGAQCVHVILVALWPQFTNLHNALPASANTTTQMMVSYIIYFLFVLPFHWIHPRRLRWFFAIKSLLCLPAIFGILIWACVTTGNGVDNPVFHRGSILHGSELGWAFMSGLNAMLGNYGTLAVNINDFTRYARRERQTWVQFVIIPTSFMLMALFGLIIVGSAERIYGELQWDVLSIMNSWNNTTKGRVGAVFAAGAMVLAQMGTNLGANCVSAANDLNAMFPRYINLRRGSFLIAFIGAWALTPWNILASADALLTFMDGYVVWLAPITGVLLADFYLVHNQFYKTRDLYDPKGRYRYNRFGTNWRAVVAWTVGWMPLLAGLANSINSANKITVGTEHFYSLGYMYGMSVSFVVYTGLNYAFPANLTMASDD
ncbi:cytosine-purine permease [Ophiostoma piceae UAMH 11346]|uniref:Cytosine-purine permease n=1 Tax=Ophiostoma piceae (strain UAMH 11346) TaxID=1262450 RepID=S3BNE3_OPHP1|nr:cytosine-purine permease [Ophiostoma piceae UAMH 11346]